jgi:hypothetical protein
MAKRKRSKTTISRRGVVYPDLPPTTRDLRQSIAHAKDSVLFNLRHAKDHLAAAKKAHQRLQRVRRVRIRAS